MASASKSSQKKSSENNDNFLFQLTDDIILDSVVNYVDNALRITSIVDDLMKKVVLNNPDIDYSKKFRRTAKLFDAIDLCGGGKLEMRLLQERQKFYMNIKDENVRKEVIFKSESDIADYLKDHPIKAICSEFKHDVANDLHKVKIGLESIVLPVESHKDILEYTNHFNTQTIKNLLYSVADELNSVFGEDIRIPNKKRNMLDMISEITEYYSSTNRNIVFTSNLSDEILDYRSYCHLFRSIHDILENKKKYSVGRVYIDIHASKENVRFVIHDNSKLKFSQVDPNVIFEKGYSKVVQGETKSTGIGMYVVKKLVDQYLGGKISAINRDDERYVGAEFIIQIPKQVLLK
jgi:hypothetical protein